MYNVDRLKSGMFDVPLFIKIKHIITLKKFCILYTAKSPQHRVTKTGSRLHNSQAKFPPE